jgi:hypothetical protein
MICHADSGNLRNRLSRPHKWLHDLLGSDGEVDELFFLAQWNVRGSGCGVSLRQECPNLAQGCPDPTGSRWVRLLGSTGRAYTRRGGVGAAESVKVFGRRPSRTFPHARRPASENLQGTKPREGARVGRCRGRSYGDLAMNGQRPRSAARSGERSRWRCSSDARRLCDLRAGVWRKIGVVNAALERTPLWPAEERADGRTAFRGGGCEIVMRCRS